MDFESRKNRVIFEGMLVVVVLGMATLFHRLGAHAMVGLNLFFLPVILSGYFLGRSAAGVLALLCALAVAIAASLGGARYAAYDSPLMVGLALSIWAAVLGLIAILMGTLCDERMRTVRDLQRAYVGVVEVLSKYLQSANPRVKDRSTRVAELSQAIAQEMKLSRRQVDDIRVAALLRDLESVEVTTQIASRAVNVLESSSRKHTFLGTDLVHSLGSVLEGALPLLVSQDELANSSVDSNQQHHTSPPLGVEIIAAARAFDELMNGNPTGERRTSATAIRELRKDPWIRNEAILAALERATAGTHEAASQPELAHV
ncbi:MAG: hypothetical protein U1D55_11535 [Phycisphaerae bacterium]